MCPFQLVLLHHHQRLVLLFFLSATNCEYFSTDEHNQKANVYYLHLSRVFQEVWDIILNELDLLACHHI